MSLKTRGREKREREQGGNKTMRQEQNWRVDISQLKRIATIVQCLPFLKSFIGYFL